MRITIKQHAGTAAITAMVLALSSSAGAWGADVGSTTVLETDTSVWTPPSPDPSGITYLPGSDRILVSDAEVDEIAAPEPGAYQGVNLYAMTRSGSLVATGTTKESGTGWSVEPTGLAYGGGSLFVSDDDKKSVFEITSPGGDGVYGTADDSPATPSGFKTSTFNNTDPEGIAYDSKLDQLLLINGQTGARFYRLTRGANGKFDGVAPTGDDIATEVDLTRYGVIDPEGIAYDAARDTILVSSDGSQKIFELDRYGSLLNTIDISGMGAQNAADVVVAPSSTGTGRSYYLVDRGLDNNSHPGENDGKVFEIKANLGPITNFPPVADAGVDQMLDLGETVTLTGAGRDTDTADTLSYRWTVTGPGPVSMATPTASTTTATFSVVGDYVFRLTVTDSKGATGSDEATVRVFSPGDARNIAVPIANGADDAQETDMLAGGEFVDLSSADNELGDDGPPTPEKMLTGFRFAGLPIPPGSEIVSAKIQFKVDEGSSGDAAFTIAGEAADNAAGYVKVAGNISSRAKTAATVPWAPPTWDAPAQPNGGDAGPGQLTPELKGILQEVVNRPGWQKGNAAAFMIWGNGRRTAEAKDGLTPPVLMLEFKTPVPNTAPVVNAGADISVVLPSSANLDGTVTDDGKPAPFTTAWSKVSGPGTVTFGNAAAVDTTASFSEAGTYTLRLTATDTELTGQDDVVVTVAPVPNVAPVVNAGADMSVVLPSSANLDGTVTDDGKPAPFTTKWSKVSGPGTVTFGNANAQDTTASFSKDGTYTLRLTADDTELKAQDDVVVTVAPVPNTAPVVNAGADFSVTLPSSANLDGAVTDDGKPAPFTTAWSKVAGPGTVTFGNVAAQDTTATFSMAGTYTLRLTADDTELKAQDDVVVTVAPASVVAPSPEPTAGTGRELVQPVLTASVADATVMLGRSATLTGTLTPSAAGQKVKVQRWNGASWVDVATQEMATARTASFGFTVTSATSGRARYRLMAPATATELEAVSATVVVKFYQARLVTIRPSADVAVVKNLGSVRVDLAGWRLVNRSSGKRVTLPAFVVRPGEKVRIHSGNGRDDRDDLYLGRSDMWGRHGKAVLRDDAGSFANRYWY